MKYENYEVTVVPGNEQSNGQVFMQHGVVQLPLPLGELRLAGILNRDLFRLDQ